MTFMRPSHSSHFFAKVLSILFLTGGILCNTAISQFVPIHLLEFKKQVSGTNGDPANPVARVGETVTAIISFQNQNEVGLTPGTYTISSIVDVVHHANGDEVSPNLLPGGLPVTLLPRDFDLSRSFIVVTNTYVVRAGDEGLGFLTDDARANGFDNHDDVLGDIPLPFVPFQSAPAQIRILNQTVICTNFVIEAISDSYNHGGSEHALWLPGISTNLIFTPTPGSWIEDTNAGTATLTGRVHSRTNVDCGFIIDVHLSGRTSTPPPGSPKLDLDSNVYVPNGPVDPSTFYYFPVWSGTLTGFGPCWDGAILDITRTGPAFQVGAGANQKNIHFGASGWFNWTVRQQRFNGPPLPATGRGDFNIDIILCIPDCPACVLRYPFASANSRTSLDFDESKMLRAYAPKTLGPGDVLKAWYNDEEAMVLGVRRVVVKTAAGTTTTDYPVSAMTSNPGAQLMPSVGTLDLTGDQAGTDPYDRPMFPALFITDITSNPLSLAGDWQSGNLVAIPPSAVFGTWKAAVRTVDKRHSPTTVTVVADSSPSKNNWNLGAGDPAPAGLLNEGYSTEVRWNVNDLALTPGHTYRAQFMLHDGDPQTGIEAAQACVTICIPAPAPLVLAPRFLGMQTLPGGIVRLSIVGPRSRSYLIEGSEDLSLWKTIATVLNTSGTLQFSDPARPSRCFYRIKLLP
jgi:hypothetical protein